MPLTIQSGAGPTIRPYSSGEFDFNVIGTADDALITSGGSTPVDILDTSVIQHTASTVDSGYELSVELLAVPDEFINDPITFELIGAAGSLSGIGSIDSTKSVALFKRSVLIEKVEADKTSFFG